jgi:hypothetical protein
MIDWPPKERASMPQILVVTNNLEQTPGTVVYRERVAPTDLESDHFSGQLVERVGWAVLDADQLEQGNRHNGAPVGEYDGGAPHG